MTRQICLTLAAALACGLMAGVFFTFSTFVMRALAQLPPAEGIRAMQAINVAAVRAGFLAAFLGAAALCLALTVLSLGRLGQPDGVWLLLGAAAYLGGGFLVTMIFNVPLNDRLAALSPADPAAAEAWARYLVEWTRWNHVRTVACLAAAAAFTLALPASR